LRKQSAYTNESVGIPFATPSALVKANGEDIKTVKELLRHANSRITLEASTYSDQFKNYLSNMGTAYAIMALKSCKVPEIP
jgi:hypothetical protein